MDLAEKILKLRAERNAVILAHNYQRPEIQDLADFVGDSLELARTAQSVDADVIVFCGVDFMAESAAILNPDKKVIMPVKEAMCPLAMMLPKEVIINAKERYPDAEVVMYVNTHAEAKAHADCICTSGNAVKVVEAMDADQIIFAPDKNLAHYVSLRTDKEIIPVPHYGMCIVHENIKLSDVKAAMAAHPKAKLTVHPEVPAEVQELAHHIGGTKGMVDFVKKDKGKEFIVGTENGLIHRMMKETHGKKFYPACETAICQNMKKTNLENLHQALKEMKHVITVPEDIAEAARIPLERMLTL